MSSIKEGIISVITAVGDTKIGKYLFPRKTYFIPTSNYSLETQRKILSKGYHPSSEIVLEECRIIYQIEESRRQGFISKTGILMAIAGLYVALLLYQYILNKNLLYIFCLLSLIIHFIYGFLVIKPEKYTHPHDDVGNYLKYAKWEPKELNKLFVMEYMKAIKSCSDTTNVVMKKYKLSIFFLMSSFIFFLLFLLFRLL